MLAFNRLVLHQQIAEEEGAGFKQIRCSIVVSILACHAGDPGSIPGGGIFGYATFVSFSYSVRAAGAGTQTRAGTQKKRTRRKKPTAPEGFPARSPSAVLAGPSEA